MEFLELIKPFVESLAGQNGTVLQALSYLVLVMGFARLFFKPLVSLVTAFVKATPSPDDDAWWVKVQGKSWFKLLEYLIDYVLSLKLPKPPEKQ